MESSGRPSLVRTFGVLAGIDAVSKALALVGFAVLSRRLAEAPGAYGALETALAAVFVATLIVDAGLAPFGSRSVAAKPESARGLFRGITRLRAAGAVVAALGLVAFCFVAKPPAAVVGLVGWYALTLVPSALMTEWFFHGRNEPFMASLPQLLRNAAMFAAAWTVHEPGDLWRIPSAEAVGFGCGVWLQRRTAAARFGPAEIASADSQVPTTWRVAAPYFTSSFAFAVRLFAPMIFAGTMIGGGRADDFGAAHRLFIALHAVLVLYFVNALPTWARLATEDPSLRTLYKQVGRSLLFVVGVAFVVAVGVLAYWRNFEEFLPWKLFIGVFGPARARGFEAFALLLCAGVVIAIEAHLRFLFLAAGRPWRDAACNIAAATTSLLPFVMLLVERPRGWSSDPIWLASVAWLSATASGLVGFALSLPLSFRIRFPMKR